MDDKKTFRDTFLRMVALLGLILVLLLGAWGIILLAFNMSSVIATVGTSITSLVSGVGSAPVQEVEEETTATTTPSPAVTPTPAPTPSNSQGTYIPATRTTNLYGYPDLAVRVLSVNSLSFVQGRSVVQFEVANIGTNIAPMGWNLMAQLPLAAPYGTYNSQSQRALYPGDRIVYTLTFDGQRYNNNYNNNDRHNDARYDECGESHNNWDEEDWLDWYQDAWDTNSHSRDDWDTNDWEDWYDDFCDDYSYNDSHNYDNNYNYNTGSRAVTIIVDPANYIREINEANNRATAQVY